jgi:hypothetical protein
MHDLASALLFAYWLDFSSMCLAKSQTIKKYTQYLVIADGGGFSSFSQTPELGFHHTDLSDADTALGIYYEVRSRLR